MSAGNRVPDGDYSSPDEVLAERAYIVVEQAHCLYKPEVDAAVKVIPPYGTEVEVVRHTGPWVLIRFYGKEAWSPRGNLSTTLRRREAVDVGVVPLPNNDFRAPSIYDELPLLGVEFGPRGGRFVRTASGFKRYF